MNSVLNQCSGFYHLFSNKMAIFLIANDMIFCARINLVFSHHNHLFLLICGENIFKIKTSNLDFDNRMLVFLSPATVRGLRACSVIATLELFSGLSVFTFVFEGVIAQMDRVDAASAIKLESRQRRLCRSFRAIRDVFGERSKKCLKFVLNIYFKNNCPGGAALW
jgi:hypothetical protein